MVAINPPPPKQTPTPVLKQVTAGSVLLRIYNPTRHNTQALSFRQFGPISRFDHHRNVDPPNLDPERGIIYAGYSLRCCLVEIFGDSNDVVVGEHEVASLTVTRDLTLLDLRGGNAMKAGTIASVGKDSNRQFSQAWSRFFYDTIYTYGNLDGLIWGNAHNNEDAIALYERAQNAITCSANDICPLRDEALRFEVQLSAAETNMYVEPY
jgi:hypothetical protein